MRLQSSRLANSSRSAATPEMSGSLGQPDIATAKTDAPSVRKPLRLWPGVAAVVLQLLFWYGIPRVVHGTTAGMTGAFPAGWAGECEVVETVRKVYMVR